MLLSLLVITTGFVQFISNDVENDEGEWGIGVHNMQFHDALYFSIITFGLVGYGDIHPTQTIGRLSMTLLITVAFISIPMQMGVLVRKFRMPTISRKTHPGVASRAPGLRNWTRTLRMWANRGRRPR